MSTLANPSKAVFSGPAAFRATVQALTRAAGRLSGRFHRQVMLPQLAEHVCARVCKSGLPRQRSAMINCLGLSHHPRRFQRRPAAGSSRSAPTRRAARSGEWPAHLVVFGLPCPSASMPNGVRNRVWCALSCHWQRRGAPLSFTLNPLPFPTDTRHNLALAECFCCEPRARQTGALTRGRWRKV